MAANLLGQCQRMIRKIHYYGCGGLLHKVDGGYSNPQSGSIYIADHLVNEVFMRHSVPEQLYSDQAPQFESQLIREVCKLLHIRKTRTTPYHPGMVEHFNRTLLNMLATHCKDHPWDWEQHIHKVCMAYNSIYHKAYAFLPHVWTTGSFTSRYNVRQCSNRLTVTQCICSLFAETVGISI